MLVSLSLHLHSVKDRLACEISEVAEHNRPGFIALDAIVLYFQSTLIFPSWTSPVRVLRTMPSRFTASRRRPQAQI
jgi:hypothetical protein